MNSHPYGANVVAADSVIGTTPAQFQFEKADSILIRVEKDGYIPGDILLRNRWDWGGLGMRLLAGAGGVSLVYLLYTPPQVQAEEIALLSYGVFTVASLTQFAIAGKKLDPSFVYVNLEQLPQEQDKDDE